MEGRIVYFEEGGAQNTQATLDLARERLGGKDIKSIVLASTTGDTARKAMEFFRDQEVTMVVVPHQSDFHREKNAFPPALAEELRRSGHQVHFGTMLFHTDEFYGSKNAAALANILRSAPSVRGSRSALR